MKAEMTTEMNATTRRHRQQRRAKSRAAAPGPRGRRPQSQSPSAKSAEPREVRGRHPLDGWRGWLLVGAFAVAAAVFVVLKAPVFSIDEVQISGAARTSEGAILSALDIPSGTALATWDAGPGTEAIAALPWVEEVRITKAYPATVRVVVRERAVTASVGSPIRQEWLVISEDGHVLERRMTPAGDSRIVLAPAYVIDDAMVGDRVSDVDPAIVASTGLPLQLDAWVDHWRIDADGAVTIGLVGGAEAHLGRTGEHRTQYVSLASILDGGTSLVCIDHIDLEVADTPVITRDAECLVAAAAFG